MEAYIKHGKIRQWNTSVGFTKVSVSVLAVNGRRLLILGEGNREEIRQWKYISGIYRSFSFSIGYRLWKALSSDGALNNEHTSTGEADVRAKLRYQLPKHRQTAMSGDVMSSVNEHSQDVNGQLTNRCIITWTVCLTDDRHIMQIKAVLVS